MDGMGALGSLQLFQRHELVSLSASDQDGCVRLCTASGTLRPVLCTHRGRGWQISRKWWAWH
jgi:hypothetical protein